MNKLLTAASSRDTYDHPLPFLVAVSLGVAAVIGLGMMAANRLSRGNGQS